MKNTSRACSAIVLAADRNPADAVAVAAGVQCKALAPVAGVPMIRRVVQALQSTDAIDRITLVGPARNLLCSEAEIEYLLSAGELDWIENASSPSASAARALSGGNTQQPVLLTTADHALLDPAMLNYFLEQALESGCDFIVGVARLETVLARFPDTRRTAARLRGGPYCGCNLFVFVTERGRQLAHFWRNVEQERKRPWRVIAGALGGGAVIRYACGRLTLEQALERLSDKLGIKIGAVVLPFAEAAVDVDTPADLLLVEKILAT
ncbi:nucleotidyltransferase family protein [Azomonas macrocytogenes]|uniref:CTP:molybdopterin cytidylyltransferase MocA n=1 Tax=Azomonas macrocytogenes TaxID=69962 RepID=A0A839SYR8_AZOMA|nr:nucleotidyltransferase family protein [Azomonas macrocytogenes]MBB3102028.1 CTP:molybdopterin cytidylyltransferase MocA [Azomonas macrocytogenes]